MVAPSLVIVTSPTLSTNILSSLHVEHDASALCHPPTNRHYAPLSMWSNRYECTQKGRGTRVDTDPTGPSEDFRMFDTV